MAAEQRFEEVAEIHSLAGAGIAIAELEAAVPAGRRMELLAAPVALADVVVRGALLRVVQRFVGLRHFLEACLGVGLLADVGMVFARQLAIGALDLVLGGVALHTEGGVVVLELHG